MNKHKSNIIGDIKIEEVKEQELEDIFPLFLQLNPSAKEVVFKRSYANIKKFRYKLYKAVTNNDNRKTFVGLIGYLFNEDLCVGRTMYIDVLVTDKKYRKRGIGKQLMDFAMSKLHEDGSARFLRWTTRNDLHEAGILL